MIIFYTNMTLIIGMPPLLYDLYFVYFVYLENKSRLVENSHAVHYKIRIRLIRKARGKKVYQSRGVIPVLL